MSELFVVSCAHNMVLVNDQAHFSLIFDFSFHTGNVGVPIKLLYEAEGMKITVEVRLQMCCVFLDCRRPLIVHFRIR